MCNGQGTCPIPVRYAECGHLRCSDINNVLEDVYIESFMCQKYPGSIQNGIQRNAALIIHHIPTQEARKAEKSDGLTIMLDMIFRYARAGRTEAEKEYDKQYCSRLNSCRKIIDEAVVSADAKVVEIHQTGH